MPILRSLTRRLTYANVASTACLFVTLGGSAYAAVSITGKNVKNGSLTSADIKNHSLRARDFRAGDLPRGPKGDRGPAGPSGAPSAGVHRPAGRLRLPDITGSGPSGTIPVRSIAWSNALDGDPLPAVGGGAGPKPVWGDLLVTTAPDRSSPQLYKLAATGQHLASAKLELVAPGAATPYATYILNDVHATRFATRGEGDERENSVALSSGTAYLAFNPAAPVAPAGESQVAEMTVDGIPGTTSVVADAWNVKSQAGKAVFGPFEVRKAVDGTSPALLGRFTSGQHIKTVTIKRYLPGSKAVYSTYVLSDAVVSSFAVAGDGRPVERIGFAAAKVESTTPVAGGAPVRACFNRVTQGAC